MPERISARKVRYSPEEIAEFNATWPCSSLRANRSYWFEFDENYNLVDCDVPEEDDGGAALALSQDAEEWLKKQITNFTLKY